MNDLDHLIKSLEEICYYFKKAAQDEKKFCDDLCLTFEKYNWEMIKMSNELKEIKEYTGC